MIRCDKKQREQEQDATKAREGRMKISTRENQPSSARTIQDCILT